MGAVRRDVVLAVLRASGVSVVALEDAKFDDKTVTNAFVLDKPGLPTEVQLLPDLVPRRLVLRFANRYGIPSQAFWHPETVGVERPKEN